ncbi:hypothetical protein EAVVTKC53_00824 [Elizabethkingia anophelis]|nr:hypothetical protein EAVVTKC53_03019 [Elizabethkingia anophelis]CAI9678924.1 hypothetical protein EAVVTKC53_00824 [Elizabethkingia anophelis]
MKKIDFISLLLNLIAIIISLIPYRKLISKNINRIHNTRKFKIINNIAIMACSICIVMCYTILALLAWGLKFNLSVFSFYVCLIGAIPIAMFSIHFYRVNYLKVS